MDTNRLLVLDCVPAGTRVHLLRTVVSVLVALLPLLIFAFAPSVSSASGDSVPWRPHPLTYSVVWVALVASLITSWSLVCVATRGSTATWATLAACYAAVVGLAVAWIPLYNCNKSHGIPVFLSLLLVLCGLIPSVSSVHTHAGALLAPLFGWGVFQLAVNCAEVGIEHSRTAVCQ
jgi:tryptophan-rich sensory protein